MAGYHKNLLAELSINQMQSFQDYVKPSDTQCNKNSYDGTARPRSGVL